MELTTEMIIPCFARHILQVGALPEALHNHGQNGVEKVFHMPLDAPLPDLAAVDPGVQCILIVMPEILPGKIEALLEHAETVARDPAQIVFFFTGLSNHSKEAEVEDLLATRGWMIYHSGLTAFEGHPGPILTVIAIRSCFNPVTHARQIAAAGRPDCAIHVLNTIPDALINDAGLMAGLALERQRHYHQWQQMRDGMDPKHAFFSKARREFAQVTALRPLMSESHRLHAQFWSFMGRDDMAIRVLRSLNFVQPGTATRYQLDGLAETQPRAADSDAFVIAPDPHRELWKPRILIITHDHPDYGMDNLYHGLCTLVGEDNVVEFPWKPTLHGQNKAETANYPCFHHYRARPKTVDQLVEQLRNGQFDFILYGDVVQMAYPEQVRRLCAAEPGLPVILYDSWDDCYTPLQLLLNYTGRSRFDLVFKREMLKGVDYGTNVFPLPFGYPDDLALRQHIEYKETSVFWAGKMEYGLRPLYIPALEKKLNRSLGERYEQGEYQERLRNSLIGLSFFGCGFDTVRYWELPANQVMLLAERPPIHIPFDFIDGQSAVFFNDLAEMLSKLDYYTQHPDEATRIAMAGHGHFLRYHTTTARARQFLARVGNELRLPVSSRSAQPEIRQAHRFGHDYSPQQKIDPEHQEKPLYLGLVGGQGYGWGVCSNYLIRELSRRLPVQVLKKEDGSAFNESLDGTLFQAIINLDFDAMFPRARGRRNIGYTFFENELTPNSLANSKTFEMVLGGSTWCRDRMLEKGIRNCGVLIQGIDPELFHPVPCGKPDSRFVIFSGGKFELRKGQDMVLRAVKIMQDRYPDVWLVNCWFNLWPASMRLMSYSRHIRFRYCEGETWARAMHRTYIENGLDPSRIITHELVPQEQQIDIFSKTDVGVFPNRCEGGTNLVMMEYMACAKPVIASYASGHKDILTDENSLKLETLSAFDVKDGSGQLIARWQECSLDELVSRLDEAYHNRSALQAVGRQAGEDLKGFTWARSAEHLLRIIGK